MIHICSKYTVLQQGETKLGVEKVTGQLSNTESLNTVISALEIRNHKDEQRFLMFKSSRCSFEIRMKRGTKRQTDTELTIAT